MSVRMMILLVAGLTLLSSSIWFYAHCSRPRLVAARARPSAFVLAQLGTVAALLAGAMFIADVAGFLPREAVAVTLLLLVIWLPAPLAYLRPQWIVRLTGGPIRA
jgi:hypothetical protein